MQLKNIIFAANTFFIKKHTSQPKSFIGAMPAVRLFFIYYGKRIDYNIRGAGNSF